MRIKELKYIKENFISKRPRGLDMILEMIDEVYEAQHEKIAKRLIREQAEGTSLTLESIPEISVTELGWTDVRTVGNQEVSGPARNQLLQFTKNIQGAGLQEKIASLSEFYNNPDSINLEGGTPGQRIANALSYLVFYKTLTKVISNFNAASAGFNFEAFLAVLLEGAQIKANTGTIADFTAGDNTPISLKLYAEKSLVVGGSFTDLVGDLVNPQFSPHDFMQYVVVLKSFEGASQGLDVKGQLKFYRFNFTLDNVANIVLNSMGKSIKCIEMPQQMIEEFEAGNADFDFNATLPSQENLPSVEELESQFYQFLSGRMQEKGFTTEEVDAIADHIDWANNEEIFTPEPRGERLMVVRGVSKIGANNAAVKAAVVNALGGQGHAGAQLQGVRSAISHANNDVRQSFSAKRMADERNKILSAQGVFADAEASVEFYNSLTDPEMKKKALMNSRGYLQTLQFDLNRGQVLNIENLAGEYTTLPEGQSAVDIGTIMIGASYVQQVLNKMTEELNQSIFTIFESVKMIQEGTYAFMAGGLQDDAHAEKAISASKDVEGKVQELRPEQGASEEENNLKL
jgi:hypothetical protein